MTGLTTGRSLGKLRLNFGEDRADLIGNTRHYRARSNRNETRHQSVFDEILGFTIVTEPETKRSEKLTHTVSIGRSIGHTRGSKP